MIGPARKSIVVDRAPTLLQPGQDTRPRRFEKLELDGSTRLLLYHHRPRADTATADEVSDANLHDIATAQLAVEGKVEQRTVPEASLSVEFRTCTAHTC